MENPLIAHFQALARYNRGCNTRLYEACAGLSDVERKQDRKAFFNSIHGTLNHLIIGDRIWLARFEGFASASTHLDAILYEDFEELREARVRDDIRIETLMDTLDDAFLARSIEYINNAGLRYDDPMPMLLTHFFNHQTHHRGQVHAMLTQTAVSAPSFDLHRVLKPEP